MGAPLGNKNATKNQVWRDAIRRVIAQKNGERLRAAAERLVSEAENGDVAALRELGDRLDGKASQLVIGPGEDGGHKLEIVHKLL